jgi:excisionase family DNA binding protein
MNNQALALEGHSKRLRVKCIDGPKDRLGRSGSLEGLSPAKGLLDYDGAAAYLSTTTRHVRELWQRREITAVKVGRLVRFTQEDLDTYVRSQRQPALRLGSPQ